MSSAAAVPAGRAPRERAPGARAPDRPRPSRSSSLALRRFSGPRRLMWLRLAAQPTVQRKELQMPRPLDPPHLRPRRRAPARRPGDARRRCGAARLRGLEHRDNPAADRTGPGKQAEKKARGLREVPARTRGQSEAHPRVRRPLELRHQGCPAAGVRRRWKRRRRPARRYRPGTEKVNLSPQQKVEHEEAVQKFAKCMREHGINVDTEGGGGVAIGIRGGPPAAGRTPKAPPSSRRRKRARASCTGAQRAGFLAAGRPGPRQGLRRRYGRFQPGASQCRRRTS